jgi:hypothetical protein
VANLEWSSAIPLARGGVVPIPDFQSLMLPLLELLSDGKDHLMKDVTRGLADRFALTDDERRALLPSCQQTIISNRVAWAEAHMKMAGLIENLVRGYVRISDAGRKRLDWCGIRPQGPARSPRGPGTPFSERRWRARW